MSLQKHVKIPDMTYKGKNALFENKRINQIRPRQKNNNKRQAN